MKKLTPEERADRERQTVGVRVRISAQDSTCGQRLYWSFEDRAWVTMRPRTFPARLGSLEMSAFDKAARAVRVLRKRPAPAAQAVTAKLRFVHPDYHAQVVEKLEAERNAAIARAEKAEAEVRRYQAALANEEAVAKGHNDRLAAVNADLDKCRAELAEAKGDVKRLTKERGNALEIHQGVCLERDAAKKTADGILADWQSHEAHCHGETPDAVARELETLKTSWERAYRSLYAAAEKHSVTPFKHVPDGVDWLVEKCDELRKERDALRQEKSVSEKTVGPPEEKICGPWTLRSVAGGYEMVLRDSRGSIMATVVPAGRNWHGVIAMSAGGIYRVRKDTKDEAVASICMELTRRGWTVICDTCDHRKPWEVRPELYECGSCSAKPGIPSYCQRCLDARAKAGDKWVGAHWMAPDVGGGEKSPADETRKGSTEGVQGRWCPNVGDRVRVVTIGAQRGVTGLVFQVINPDGGDEPVVRFIDDSGAKFGFYPSQLQPAESSKYASDEALALAYCQAKWTSGDFDVNHNHVKQAVPKVRAIAAVVRAVMKEGK